MLPVTGCVPASDETGPRGEPLFSTFIKSYGGPGNDLANDIRQTVDGGFVIVGAAEMHGHTFGRPREDLWVVKQDAVGNVEWSRTYGDNFVGDTRLDFAFVRAVCQTSDGGYVIAGEDALAPDESDFTIVKLDPSGLLVWRRDYERFVRPDAVAVPEPNRPDIEPDPAGSSIVSELQEMPDGDLLLVGSDRAKVFLNEQSGTIVSDTDVMVMRLTTEGEPIWRRLYGENDAEEGAFPHIHAMADRGAAVVTFSDPTGADVRGRIWRLDSAGGVIWENRDAGGIPGDVTQTDDDFDGERDDGIVVAGTRGGDFWIKKLNADGSEQWTRTIDFGDGDHVATLVDPVTIDGPFGVQPVGYVVAGYTEIGRDALWDSTVATVELDGTVTSTWVNDEPLHDQINHIQWTGSEFLFAGFTGEAESEEYRGWIGALTPDLALVTDRRFELPSPNDRDDKQAQGFLDLQAARDGGFVLFGQRQRGSAFLGWVTMVTAEGTVQWERRRQVAGFIVDTDVGRAIEQTDDRGFIVVGNTDTFSEREGNEDVWVLKLTPSGDIEWQKTFGSSSDDGARAVQQTADGGYIVAGFYDFRLSGPDLWLLRLDRDGNLIWSKTYGGDGGEEANAVRQTRDGGFIAVGNTRSFGDDKAWVLRLDPQGDILWEYSYGEDTGASSVVQTDDDGYTVAGGANNEAWMLKLDAQGNVEWSATFGTPDVPADDDQIDINADRIHAIQPFSNGGYIVTGKTEDERVGGGDNMWVVRLNVVSSSADTAVPVEIEWERIYGGRFGDVANAVDVLSEGGYIVAGETRSITSSQEPGEFSSGDAWVLKLGVDGDVGIDCPVRVFGVFPSVPEPFAVVRRATSALVVNVSQAINDTTVVPTNVFADTLVTRSCSGFSYVPATDPCDSNTTSSIRVSVVVPPHAAFTCSPANPRTGEVITFDASTSRVWDGDACSGSFVPPEASANYIWDFDADGVTDATGPVVTHTYPPGTRNAVVELVMTVDEVPGRARKDLIFGCDTNWCPLAVGVDGEVWSLTTSPDGSDLYVGGGFRTAGGQPAGGIARWDGAQWSPLGQGLRKTGFAAVPIVTAMRFHDDGGGNALFVGGDFDSAVNADGTTVDSPGIVKWDGTAWQAVGGGVAGGFIRVVKALAEFNGDLYVGGRFEMAGSVAASGLARWDGTDWHAVAGNSGVAPQFVDMNDLLVHDGQLYAGDAFNVVTFDPFAFLRNVARWNGSEWAAVGTDAPPVQALASFDGAIVGGGRFSAGGLANLAQWNGSTWEPLGGGADGQVSALTVVNDAGRDLLFVGGRFRQVGSVSASGIAQWDGAQWAALPGDFGAPGAPLTWVNAIALYDGSIVAGGLFLTVDDTIRVNNIARFELATPAPAVAAGVAAAEVDSLGIVFSEPGVSTSTLTAEASVTVDLPIAGSMTSTDTTAATASVSGRGRVEIERADASRFVTLEHVELELGAVMMQFGFDFGMLTPDLVIDVVRLHIEAMDVLRGAIGEGGEIVFDRVPVRIHGMQHVRSATLGIDELQPFKQVASLNLAGSTREQADTFELRLHTLVQIRLTLGEDLLPPMTGLAVRNIAMNYTLDLRDVVFSGSVDDKPAVPGDFDGDNDVDLADLLIFEQFFTQPGRLTLDPRTDLDGDGDTDLSDLVFFQTAFTGSQ